MAFYHLPHPWNPGYAIPDYVMAEPPGRGTFTTAWLPRGTISEIVPDFLAKPVEKKVLGRTNAGLGGLGSLGDTTLDGTVFGGHSLATPTLAGDSLGAKKYVLESLGAASRLTYPLGDDGFGDTLLKLALVGGVAWWLLKKYDKPARAAAAAAPSRRGIAKSSSKVGWRGGSEISGKITRSAPSSKSRRKGKRP